MPDSSLCDGAKEASVVHLLPPEKNQQPGRPEGVQGTKSYARQQWEADGQRNLGSGKLSVRNLWKRLCGHGGRASELVTRRGLKREVCASCRVKESQGDIDGLFRNVCVCGGGAAPRKGSRKPRNTAGCGGWGRTVLLGAREVINSLHLFPVHVEMVLSWLAADSS